jgi:hypothetical protein
VIKPHKTIGVGYLERWHIIPRNRFFNIYLHKFSGSDDDRALHDHPWSSVSFLLKGRLREVTNTTSWMGIRVRRFVPFFRSAKYAHKLVLLGEKPAWTLFITGPVVREWGFLCPKGWQHWSTMTDKNGNTIGGCE